MDDERQKVLNCVAQYQLDNAKSTPIAHVLLQDRPEAAMRLREVIRCLVDERLLIYGDYNSSRLYVTPTGLLMSDFAHGVAQFTDNLLRFFISRIEEDGVRFEKYTWDELKRFGVVLNDSAFNFAITVIQTLHLYGNGHHNAGTSEHSPMADLKVPSDLVDFRSFFDIRDLYKRAERKQEDRAATTQVQNLVIDRLGNLDRSQWLANSPNPKEYEPGARDLDAKSDNRSREDCLRAVLDSLDGHASETLASHIRLIDQSRSRMYADANGQILGERNKLLALRGWQEEQTRTAMAIANQLIDACLKLGVLDDQVIADFVSVDHNNFIRSSALSTAAGMRGRDRLGAQLQMQAFTATTYLGIHRALDMVRIARFDKKYMPMSTQPTSSTTKPIKIFISHSARDQGLAGGLARCLDDCLELPDGTIRCTSAPGYALSPGAVASESLRQNIEQSIIVIGLLTEDSLRSGYVIMELGAAWALQKLTCLMLAPTLEYDRIPGPLAERHAIRSNSAHDIAGLMETISNAVGAPMRSRQRSTNAVNTFVDSQAHAAMDSTRGERTS